jgi:hypothetical protein
MTVDERPSTADVISGHRQNRVYDRMRGAASRLPLMAMRPLATCFSEPD